MSFWWELKLEYLMLCKEKNWIFWMFDMIDLVELHAKFMMYKKHMVVTSTPSNEAELQLYRVLQKASLLAYYDTLLEMGGDDVQQLCDAGEEEFLEIMALVGMASKPLHVRRLQKALHEYMTNPSAFQAPLPSVDKPRATYSPEPSTILPHRPSAGSFIGAQNYAPSPTSSTTPSTASSLSNLATNLQQVSTNTLQLTPSLSETQVKRIMDAAERLSRTLPQLEPRPQSSKKRSTRDLELVILMDENDPQRMDEIRKYSAIYGRFDCKRKPEKPLTLHEVCVNEAAAQICKYIPALLTRRDELFPLARQVVRDAGFGHSTSIRLAALSGNTQSSTPNRQMTDERDPKRTRLSSETSSDMGKDYSEDIRDTPFSLYHRFDRPFDLSDASKFGYISVYHYCLIRSQLLFRYSRSEFDDTDSRFSFSNSSSSPMQTSNNGMDRESAEAEVLEPHIKEEVRSKSADILNPLGVQVISSSGGHIIAVANPALALSPALADVLPVKREVISPELN
uniref:CSON002733 protein n=1 Tax=Culicoides sonorensis TaxID=179676 RepID=A0A336MJS0_CULSO